MPASTLALVHLRASQINGCNACVDGGCSTRQEGRRDRRADRRRGAWRDTPYFTDAERAALALTEAVTRLSDRRTRCRTTSGTRPPGTTTSRRWRACSSTIATTNVYNRLNVPTRQEVGNWG